MFRFLFFKKRDTRIITKFSERVVLFSQIKIMVILARAHCTRRTRLKKTYFFQLPIETAGNRIAFTVQTLRRCRMCRGPKSIGFLKQRNSTDLKNRNDDFADIFNEVP